MSPDVAGWGEDPREARVGAYGRRPEALLSELFAPGSTRPAYHSVIYQKVSTRNSSGGLGLSAV